jgi:hypothetical protein
LTKYVKTHICRRSFKSGFWIIDDEALPDALRQQSLELTSRGGTNQAESIRWKGPHLTSDCRTADMKKSTRSLPREDELLPLTRAQEKNNWALERRGRT